MDNFDCYETEEEISSYENGDASHVQSGSEYHSFI